MKMKKNLFILAVAAVALASCSSDDTIAENSNVGKNQQKEIAFMPVTQKATRAAVDGTVFPTTLSMKVAAYDVTNTRDFFAATTFSHSGSGTIWTGGKYWPLSVTDINFLAIANANADNETGVTWGAPTTSASPYASKAVVVMSDNSSAQRDLMYAKGFGQVTQSGTNGLTFPTNVPMVFEHAQAWISFTATADATSGGKVTLNYITLNGASYSGTYTITHANYNASSGQTVSGVWTALGNKGTDNGDQPTNVIANVTTPYTQTVTWTGWDDDSDAGTANVKTIPNGSVLTIGDGLMIVPDDAATGDFISFTVNYTLDGNTYNYTYTPASTNVEQKKHYIYDITFKLHEIQISATVTDWVDQTAVDVPII